MKGLTFGGFAPISGGMRTCQTADRRLFECFHSLPDSVHATERQFLTSASDCGICGGAALGHESSRAQPDARARSSSERRKLNGFNAAIYSLSTR